MPWVEQPLGSGPWEVIFVFDDQLDQYSEMGTITYADALETPYDTDLWTEQPLGSGPWV